MKQLLFRWWNSANLKIEDDTQDSKIFRKEAAGLQGACHISASPLVARVAFMCSPRGTYYTSCI